MNQLLQYLRKSEKLSLQVISTIDENNGLHFLQLLHLHMKPAHELKLESRSGERLSCKTLSI